MTNSSTLVMHNKIFAWIALATGLLLLIPFLAMRFQWQLFDPDPSASNEVLWTLSDFVVMGTLIFGTSSLYVLVARKTRQHHLIIGTVFALAFLWLWAELAVGVFTNWGS